MPNRILREGILTSERVNLLSWEAEVFYRRLMSVVDDFGRFHAHPALLRAALYPLKLESAREAAMERLLADVEQARLVRLYEAGGKRYLEMQDFRQQVRAKVSKYPPPPEMAPEITAAAQQMQSRCKADVHLAGVKGEGENRDAGVSASEAAVEAMGDYRARLSAAIEKNSGEKKKGSA